MKQYVIEREIAGIGNKSPQQLSEGSACSNAALAKLAPDVQWVHSYVCGDKTFCIYLSRDEELIHKHAELSGFPASKITEVKGIISPMTEFTAA